MSTPNQEKEEKWEEDLRSLLGEETHEYCVAHNEGQYCHLDDKTENRDNIMPKLKGFVRQTLASQKAEIVEKIEKYVAGENFWDNHPKVGQFQKGALHSRNKMMAFIKSLTEKGDE